MMTMLVINVPPQLGEDMVDYLLSLCNMTGFTSYLVRGHGDNENMTLTEQVSGRRQRLQFELILEEKNAEDIIGGLLANVGKDITYWQQQIANFGHV